MPKDTQISIRLEADLAERAEALVRKLGGVATRVAILREAMREGMAVLEARYADLPSTDAVPKRRKRG